MRPAKNIEKLIKNIDIDTNAKVDKIVLDDVIEAFESSKNKKSATYQPNIWRIIMKSSITKLCAAAAIVVATLIGIHLLSSVSRTSLAFADILKHIRSSSYAFDLTVVTQEEASATVQAMVLEPGRMRFDTSTGLGKISSIINTSEGKNLFIFHKQKAAYMFDEVYDPEEYAGAVGIIALCTKPISNLWNLRDGTEKKLGQRDIDGQTTEGFRVLQEDEIFQNDITIWAHAKTGEPVLVEMISKSQDDSSKSMTWTMNNFDLDVELAESMFSLDLPPGYTLSHQLDLDDLQTDTESSVEGKKIEEMLALWSQDQKTKAVEILLGIDWTKIIEFSDKTYIFTLTEKEYISLKPKDQKEVMNEVMGMSGTIRKITRQVQAMGQKATSAKDYEKAGRYFEAVLQFGKLLIREPDNMLIVRLVGIAVQKLALKEQVGLYTETNNQEKVEAAEKQLQELNAESERIKNNLKGQ